MADRVRVGLVGSGPWAEMFHGPMLAKGPDTELVGVWARRIEAARETAAKLKVVPFEHYEGLLAACDAVAFAVAPAGQPALAEQAARAGKALLLEKPLADDLESAERMVRTIEETGVPSMVVLTYRYMDTIRDLLAQIPSEKTVGGRLTFVGNGLRSGPFAFGWRLERGVLMDLGPHLLDLAEAAFGEITNVQAHGDPLRWVGLLVDHADGARSQVAISGVAGVERTRMEFEVFTETRAWQIDGMARETGTTLATIQREFAECVRTGKPHPLSASHALGVHRWLHRIEPLLR